MERKKETEMQRDRDRGRMREVKRERVIRREHETSAEGGGHCIQKLGDIL